MVWARSGARPGCHRWASRQIECNCSRVSVRRVNRTYSRSTLALRTRLRGASARQAAKRLQALWTRRWRRPRTRCWRSSDPWWWRRRWRSCGGGRRRRRCRRSAVAVGDAVRAVAVAVRSCGCRGCRSCSSCRWCWRRRSTSLAEAFRRRCGDTSAHHSRLTARSVCVPSVSVGKLRRAFTNGRSRRIYRPAVRDRIVDVHFIRRVGRDSATSHDQHDAVEVQRSRFACGSRYCRYRADGVRYWIEAKELVVSITAPPMKSLLLLHR